MPMDYRKGEKMFEGLDDDVEVLHSMGYVQELSRGMGGFSNFAISLSTLCILAGGITSFPTAMATGSASASLSDG